MKIQAFTVLVLSISSCLLKQSVAQIKVSIAPELGYQAIQSYVIDNSTDPTFRPHNRHFSPSYGVSIQVDSKRRWMYAAGWNSFSPVLGFKYSETGRNLWRTTGALSHRFSLGIQKTIGSHPLLRIKEDSDFAELLAY